MKNAMPVSCELGWGVVTYVERHATEHRRPVGC